MIGVGTITDWTLCLLWRRWQCWPAAASLLAIWENARDLTGDQLLQLGLPQRAVVPSESIISRALAGLNADDLEARIAS